MKTKVKTFFEKKIREVTCPRQRLDGVSFKQITEEENQMLIAQFGDYEIKETK